MPITGQYFQISDECRWQFVLQVYCVSHSVVSRQSRGKGPKSCLTNVFVLVIMVSGDLVSSWAAAVVVDRCCATCPWEMLSTREFNQPLSQRGMCIPIALCSIAIVAVVWPVVSLCFPAKTLFSPQLVVTFASHPPPSHD